MSDPIDELSRLDDAWVDAPMPPAAEIRARGDRVRRRRYAVLGVASAAVVAAVTVPAIALSLGGSDKTATDVAPPPSPSPSISDEQEPTDVPAPGDWPTSIPADFPLTSGWPEDDGSSEFRLDVPSEDNQAMAPAGELDGCQPIDGGDPVDRLTARIRWGTDHYSREIQLFADDRQATAYLDSIQDAYSACEAGGPTTDGPPFFSTEVSDGSIGEESYVITRASDGIGRVVVNVVRVGNGVAIDLASDEGTGDTVVDLATETRENLGHVIAALAELQGAGVADGTGTPTDPATTSGIPADFAIDIALDAPPFEDAATTVTGPAPEAAGARALTMCGQELAFPSSDDLDPEHRLGYSVSTIVGYDGRTLHAYSTAQEAVDQMDLLRSQIQGCDRDNGGDGLADRLFRTFSSTTGYDSVTFGWSYEATEFQPAGSGQIYTVVRVGHAVLAIEWAAEWSAASMADNAPRQVDLARLVAAEMCVFAEAGCRARR